MIQRMPTCKVLDTSAKLTATSIAAIVSGGYSGVARYVRLPGVSEASDIDAAELEAIAAAGLGLLLVQHVRYPGWNPASYSGSSDAAAALDRASAAGYPLGAHIFVDLEGINGTAHATINFANEWADAIVAAGYLAGCYVGYSVPLTPAQLYDLHDVNSYWSDPGNRAVATRGCAIEQGAQIYIGGIPFDPDKVTPDQLGETPFWLIGDDGNAVA